MMMEVGGQVALLLLDTGSVILGLLVCSKVGVHFENPRLSSFAIGLRSTDPFQKLCQKYRIPLVVLIGCQHKQSSTQQCDHMK